MPHRREILEILTFTVRTAINAAAYVRIVASHCSATGIME
jgi:hypothetical protein